MSNKTVIVLDMNNLFLRSYIMDPTISLNGPPIGGIRGFFRSLQKICRELNPTKIVACWDGEGGSQKRRQITKEYKEGRKPLRLNRSVQALTTQQVQENQVWQNIRVMEYLNQTPIIQLGFPGVEADDVISKVVQSGNLAEYKKIIVSADKDFWQLITDDTIVYRPIGSEIKTKEVILDEFSIHPNNFALARSLVGDKSDNLPGIPGAGLKTVAKRFPFLKEEKDFSISELLEYSTKMLDETKLKFYPSIIENRQLILRNYKMMQLKTPLLSAQAAIAIRRTLTESEYIFNRTAFRSNMMKDGFDMQKNGFSELFAFFNNICLENRAK
jgi:DNA polymerase I